MLINGSWTSLPAARQAQTDFYIVINYCLLFNLSFRLFSKEYMTGTIIKVKKVAKVKPKIMAQDIGPQNATFSPPI